jgi:hypothetical protein
MSRRPLAAALALLLPGAASLALAQDQGQGQDQTGMQHHHMMQGTAMPGMAGPLPTLPGQDAFAAIQEVVRILEADPATDWSKVNLEALREHLIDMNEVTLHAVVVDQPVEGGVASRVTGSGRTLEAIRRMVPAQARQLAQVPGWHAEAAALPDGEQLTVRADDPREVAHLRGLGFIGLMVTGSHHQAHHLALAKGEPMP